MNKLSSSNTLLSRTFRPVVAVGWISLSRYWLLGLFVGRIKVRTQLRSNWLWKALETLILIATNSLVRLVGTGKRVVDLYIHP